ncbi:MAG: hypothetical protein ACOCUI_04080 [bacterium]
MNIPKSCEICKYGNTFDLSVDDLCTYCYITGIQQDWCDFPNRLDKTLRMHGCPLPDLTDEQIEITNKRITETKNRRKIIYRLIHGKTKLIRKRNLGRARKCADESI